MPTGLPSSRANPSRSVPAALSLPITVRTLAHDTSLAVWGVPSPVVIDHRLRCQPTTASGTLSVEAKYGLISNNGVPSRQSRPTTKSALPSTRTSFTTLMAIGLGLAAIVGQGMRAMTYQGRAADAAMLGLALAVLTTAAFFASWIPARRATRITPTRALRE